MLEPLYVQSWNPSSYDEIIDVRSPAEFAEDHVPGAVNLPVLSDAQRAEVGTIYVQVSVLEARRLGAAFMARNIADHLSGHFADRGKDYRPLVYCWRGGMRSRGMALILCEVGWRTAVIQGGYKTYRRGVLRLIETIPGAFRLIVLMGHTGSGKTRMLKRLEERGSQVIDLEGMVRHRGSLLGDLPGPEGAQPPQKLFESDLAEKLHSFDPARPVWIEAESSRIGAIHLPLPLWQAMRNGVTVALDVPLERRVELLAREYDHLVRDAPRFAEKLVQLAPRCGWDPVHEWRRLLEAGDYRGLAEGLLRLHYDPSYERSSAKIFRAPSATVRHRGDEEAVLGELADFEKSMPGNG